MKLTLTPHGKLCQLENEIGAEEIVRRASGWIKLSERKPTEEEADDAKRVLTRNRNDDYNFYSVGTHWGEEIIYWHPLPKFQEQQDKDEEAFDKVAADYDDNEVFYTKREKRKYFWDAALEYARNK